MSIRFLFVLVLLLFLFLGTSGCSRNGSMDLESVTALFKEQQPAPSPDTGPSAPPISDSNEESQRVAEASDIALVRSGDHITAGRFEEAIRELTDALQRDPQFAQGYLRRGYAYAALSRYELAANDYRRAIEIEPTKSLPYNNLAWLYATADDWALRDGDIAMEFAQQAFSLENKWQYIDTLAAIYVVFEKYKGALKQYQRAIRLGGADCLKAYQQDLQQKGYYKGEVNGVMNPQTEAALQECVQAGCQLMAN